MVNARLLVRLIKGFEMRSLRVLVLASGISALSLTAMAGFTTSELGKGGFVDGSSVGDILNNFLGTNGAQQIDLTDLSTLATALSSSDSFDYSSNASLALFDQNNDGEISEQEFVNILNGIGVLDGVDTTDNGIYAQAYATELAAMTSPITLAQIQTAITTGNTYAVDAPQVQTTTLAFSGLDSSHSSSLGILDGLGNSLDNASANVITSFSASHTSDSNATSRFAISATGALTLASDQDIEDLQPGTYTISVTATDDNTLSYDRDVTTDVSLTVSNERGCIINNGIASANFNAGGDGEVIEGATVTISGSHDENDKLFVRTAASIAVDDDTDDVTYSSIPGYSGITNAVYDKSSGELVFNGSLTLANWVEVFKLVGYIFDDNGSNPNETRSLIFSLSNNIPYNHPDGEDHFYNFDNTSLTFENARIAADNTTLFGLQGYLATITSQAEQEYIEPKIGGQGWIGACDRMGETTIRDYCGLTSTEVSNLFGQSSWVDSNGDYSIGQGEGYWYWISGPERLDYMGHDRGNSSTHHRQRTYSRGTSVFNQDNATQTYTNFKGGEPNNYLINNSSCTSNCGGENMLHFYSDGRWNDYSNNSGSIQGYLIEYGGMDGDPVVDLTEDKTYTIATEGQFCAHQ